MVENRYDAEKPILESMRLAGAQIPCGTNIQVNKKEILKAIDWAKENEVDHLLTPEGSLSGWVHGWEEKIDEIREALKEIEEHAKGIGLHLGTNFIENETCGLIQRNEIRHYNKAGQLRGSTMKTLPILGAESALPRDQKRDELCVIDLYETSIDDVFPTDEHSLAAGLICNDLYGAQEDYLMRPLTAVFKEMGVLDLIFHATNGVKIPEGEPHYDVFEKWHEGHLRMAAWSTGIPILTVDSCTDWQWEGDEDEVETYTTSSTSGLIHPIGGWEVTAPRRGRHYFKYDYTPLRRSLYDPLTGKEL